MRDRYLLPIQFLFSLITLVFCIYQIRHDATNVALYWGGISSILGYWLPSPINNKKQLKWEQITFYIEKITTQLLI